MSGKPNPPAKKSVFERQKAEAEAKKAREKAETAAALQDFVKSFEDDGDDAPVFSKGGSRGGPSAMSSSYGGGPGKRHFTSSGLKSGPGSLGPVPTTPKSGPGSLGPSPGFGKKRQYDDFATPRGRYDDDVGRSRDRDDRERRDRLSSYTGDRERHQHRDPASFVRSDDEDEGKDADDLKAAAKPTLHLSSLPPGTSSAVIKALFVPSPLAVENVRILPPAQAPSGDRKSLAAIVTLAAETPATDIDTMVSHLQNKYLGFGFKLSISRHLSSAALGASTLSSLGPTTSLPFGAKPIPQAASLSRAPPPDQRGARFAPPVSYTSSTPYSQRQNLPPTQVVVTPPSSLKTLKLIHKTVEALFRHGPEFEALLMSRPAIQRDESWSWLWDSRSQGGVYYRWRLWEILTNAHARRKQSYPGAPAMLFEGYSPWISPASGLKFEYATRLEEFISDDDYNSSDEEDYDGNDNDLSRRHRDHITSLVDDNDGQGYLNPLAKTKLIHLLSRLPDSHARLRRGDVARVTAFAIEHAGCGADEVAALVTHNVVSPFCYAVKQESSDHPDAPPDDDNQDNTDDRHASPALADGPDGDRQKDTTPASLVALYVISDILSSSSSAGVRHAWRYRALFETQLRAQGVFETLGRAERRLGWGKLKGEKWRRSVGGVLSLWEGWCVFPQNAHQGFVDVFASPPLTRAEEAQAKAAAQKEAADADAEDTAKKTSRWRTVDEAGDVAMRDAQGRTLHVENDGGGVDGAPMADDDDDDDADNNINDDDDEDATMADADLDGVPMLDSSDEDDGNGNDDDEEEEEEEEDTARRGLGQHDGPAPETSDATEQARPSETASPTQHEAGRGVGKRARPRAADFDDMFE